VSAEPAATDVPFAAAGVSVVVPARDDEPWLAAAIVSVLAQGPRIGEVLICTEHSGSPAAREAARHGDRVRAVRSGGGRVDQKLNAGLACAGGEWLAFLDADDVWPARRLTDGLDAYARIPGLEICFGRQLAITADGVHGNRPTAAPLLGTTLLRRETAGRIGPFTTPELTSAMRWLLRARELGLRSTMLDDVLLYRRIHAGNLTRASRPELHAAYLELVRGSLARRRRAER
jgi:glycosyltransferase involved in cell wall biosynthesis